MDELEQNRADLRDIINSPGGRYLLNHIQEQSKDGWDKFIALPVAQKTSKEAFNCQARYEVLKHLVEWIKSEIAMVS
jgi:hypothetical protein